MFLTLLVAVVVLGVLIFVHELGHFIAAKAVGVGVPRFSIGFGPPTPLTLRRGETEYVVSWFPLGGYVKMASREEQEAMSTLEGGETTRAFPPDKLFENKSLAARILVITAGVTMNALFAWVAYAGIVAIRGRSEDPTTSIGRVDSGVLPVGASQLASVPLGTQVIRVNEDTVRSWREILQAVLDPTSERLRFDFAGDLDPITVPIPGTDARARVALAGAIQPAWEPRAGSVTPGMPGAQAGIAPGDMVVAINGDTVRVWHDIPPLVEGRAGDTLNMLLLRADSLFELQVVPQERTVRNALTGEARKVGQIGLGIPELAPLRVEYGLGSALVEGGRWVRRDAELVLFTLRGMVIGQISVRDLGGPILIAQVSGQVAHAGLFPLVAFMAFLSVNLAILNLLPIPVLDGGQLVFLILEGIRRKPLSLDLRLRLTQVGVVVLLGLFVLVFVNDIVRLFGG